MNHKDLFSLQNQFPELKFARDADQWIEKMRRESFKDQLLSRRVTEFSVKRTMFEGELRTNKSHHFSIAISVHGASLSHRIFVTGHLLARTFYYDLTKDPPVRTIPASELMSNHTTNTIEFFCGEFSIAWIMANDPVEFERYCIQPAKFRF